ncbi:MAG: 4-(cytidine 5'-diphospho)-2-C-methyl-D-erythritol kinase [Clostridiales bacterium]|nr:4-(cytidine 5'-diphospho)-2-C-methyl-D-erythritol kinase [Clostridiales bacterium]
MEEIFVKAYAKINTVLDIKGTYPNGYHILDMIMLSIDLCDELRLYKTEDEDIELYINGASLAADNSNLVYRAIDVMRKRFNIKQGVGAELKKKIPMAAGLAGGSADCAAALKGMVKLFDINIEEKELFEIGKSLGADVPFCLFGRPARARGIGEILTPVPDFPPCTLLLAKPPVGVPTPEAFRKFDRLKNVQHPDTEKAVEYMKKEDLEGVCGAMGNVLEGVTIKKHPIVGEIKEEMLRLGAVGALMSGSGSSVFGVFKTEEAAEAAYPFIKEKFGLSEIFVTKILPQRFFV